MEEEPEAGGDGLIRTRGAVLAVEGKFEAIERLSGIGWVAKGWAVDAEAPDEPVRLALTYEGVCAEIFPDQIIKLLSRSIAC